MSEQRETYNPVQNAGSNAAHSPWVASGEYWTPAGWLGIAEAGQDVAMARNAEYQRRIVAEHNACAGLSTAALEAVPLAKFAELVDKSDYWPHADNCAWLMEGYEYDCDCGLIQLVNALNALKGGAP